MSHMKSPLRIFALVLGTALVVPASAQNPRPFVADFPPLVDVDDDGPLSEPRHIAFHMTPDEVVLAMKGKPDAQLAPDIWVYWAFRTAGDPAMRKFDTLVVFFSRNRVFKYRLVERKQMVALIAERRKAEKAAGTVAAQ